MTPSNSYNIEGNGVFEKDLSETSQCQSLPDWNPDDYFTTSTEDLNKLTYFSVQGYPRAGTSVHYGSI